MLNSFIEGSSLVYSIFTLLYVGNLNSKALNSKGTLPIWGYPGILALYGLANVVVKQWDQGKYDWVTYAIVGAGLGLLLSIIGKSFKLPTTLFGFTEATQTNVHWMAMLLYAFIFVVWIRNLNRYQAQPICSFSLAIFQ